MYYITTKLAPYHYQMSFEDMLFGAENARAPYLSNEGNTKTIEVEQISYEIRHKYNANIPYIIGLLHKFNERTEELRTVNRHDLYESFAIPKKSGGLRHIDAPKSDLKSALRDLKSIIEEHFTGKNGALYHTSAFAYVKGRCHKDALVRHQNNASKWFLKMDFSNFFGSTTLEFTMKMLSKIYPFCDVIENPVGKAELEKAIELAFLDGVLPQGTPISPTITNIIMIPIDYKLRNILNKYNGKTYIYTRYADDTLISCRYSFMFREIEAMVNGVLKEFEAPFLIKPEKTRYGSSSGRNWNLGLMLNKDNEITVGAKKKRQLKAMLTSYITDSFNGVAWDLSDIQVMNGLISYYRSVEKKNIDEIIENLSRKFCFNIEESIKNALCVRV